MASERMNPRKGGKTLDAAMKAMSEMALAAQPAIEADPQRAASALLNARTALNRIARRAEPAPAGWAYVDLVQSDGPTLCFRGKLLAETVYTMKSGDALRIMHEVWETEAGTMIAITSTTPATREGDEKTFALVIEKQADEHAMHMAAMGHFRWSTSARKMARDVLQWNLKVDVA